MVFSSFFSTFVTSRITRFNAVITLGCPADSLSFKDFLLILLLPLATGFLHANLTLPITAIRGYIQCVFCVKMPVGASVFLQLNADGASAPLAAPDVFLISDSFKMLRVSAAAIPAQMIYSQPVCGPHPGQVDEPVNPMQLSVKRKVTVAA
jgi:hypothetical protein